MILNLTHLSNSICTLEQLLKKVSDDEFMSKLDDVTRNGLQAGVIKNFEISYELCWKSIQRWLQHNYISTEAEFPRTRKDLFRMAATTHLIDNPEAWFEYGDARNLSSHVYDEDTAAEVYQISFRFVLDARHLLLALDSSND